MLATLLDVPVESKEVAITIADAALLVTQEGLSQGNGRVRIDERSLEESLSLLDVATNHAPSVRGIWSVFVTLSKYDLMSPEHKAYWAERLGDLFARSAPDFYVHTLEGLIESEPSPDARLELWDDVYTSVRKRRPDLAAFALERQAMIHETLHQSGEAIKLYRKIIDDYHDAGPFVIKALEKAEQVYRRENKPQLAVRMYQVTFQRTSKPSGVGGELLGASNWYRIGQRYAELLDEAGQSRQADQVRQELRRVLNG
jgi:tetratricopeptide (TPR) repeat protein